MIGLPGSGKTCLFRALTGAEAAGYTDKPHLGVATIPDPRLEVIASFITTKKVVPATIQLVDIPGLPVGAEAHRLNSFLEHVRQVDALIEVVRAADYGGLGTPDPARDIDQLDTELVLADLVVAESARDRAARPARAGDADARERLALLERVYPVLEEGRPVRTMVDDLSEAERKILRSYGLISAKPVLYVANVAEDDIDGGSDAARAVVAHAEATGGQAVAVCAELEAELSELEPDDRPEMLESMGLAEPAIGPLARAANELLGLTCFYTAGDKEVRAWIISAGATAPQAAGAVHSDIERGFIRAECYKVDELVEHKSEKAIRDAGRLRSEGKHYELQDGDVVHFLFNV
jgi:GTP-binding protein YchF